MSNKNRDMRGMTIKVPRIPIRWSAVSSAGAITAISTNTLHEPTLVWAVVVLAVSANVCEVIAAVFAAPPEAEA